MLGDDKAASRRVDNLEITHIFRLGHGCSLPEITYTKDYKSCIKLMTDRFHKI